MIKELNTNLSVTNKKYTQLENNLINLGYVDIQSLDPSIKISMMYAQKDNFVGRELYHNLYHAFLHQNAAQGLIKAQQSLKQEYPDYSLMVYDALRPISIQQELWEQVKNTDQEKYVANPNNGGGLHNYGLAVDISIIDENNQPLHMGVSVDHFGKESHVNREKYYLNLGIFKPEYIKNRQLLRKVMYRGGFTPLNSEWWHFNFKSLYHAKKHYRIVE